VTHWTSWQGVLVDHPNRGVEALQANPDVLEHNVQAVPPPLVPPHVEIIQYLLAGIVTMS